MYGQNEINILYADALATYELENPKTDKGNKQKPQIDNHTALTCLSLILPILSRAS